MARRVSTVQVVDTLAEITRYQDRELLERSLVKTLSEAVPCKELRLYKVIKPLPEIKLLLIAYQVERQDVAAADTVERFISPALSEGIAEAVESGEVTSVEEERKAITDVVYPIFDKDGDIFAVFVQFVDTLRFEDQRLTFGLLRVYSNYLTLLDENQKDKLTNLLNRETLNAEVMKIMTSKSHRRGGKFQRRTDDLFCHWLAVIDIDYFKRINDSYGHLFGDEILILLARLMNDVFREEDLLFRYGGEEFVVIIKVLNKKDAISVFERFRHRVEQHLFPQVGNMTVSIGMVEIGHQDGAAEVIGSADRALYYAKHSGRNQLCVYEDLVDAGALEEKQKEQVGSIDLF